MDPQRADDSAHPDPAVDADAATAVRSAVAWLTETNHSTGLVSLIRRARRALPGDPEFGDPLSTAGDDAPSTAARAADRLIRDRESASREVGLAGLQLWQAISEKVSRKPANAEVTIVFTDLVGFSTWSLAAGDDATLRLLRKVAAAIEPPLLDRGGHIVKRMGDGLMAVFRGGPDIAVAGVLAAVDALAEVEVDGYTPRMRAGLHTGRPQRIGGDWLGVDVNIAARVMERATRGGVMISGQTLERIPPERLDELGVYPKKVRRQLFAAKPAGVPADLTMYRLLATARPVTEDEYDD